MLIYEYKYHTYGQEYYYKSEIAYNCKAPQRPNCGTENYDESNYLPFSRHRSGRNPCASTRFG